MFNIYLYLLFQHIIYYIEFGFDVVVYSLLYGFSLLPYIYIYIQTADVNDAPNQILKLFKCKKLEYRYIKRILNNKLY